MRELRHKIRRNTPAERGLCYSPRAMTSTTPNPQSQPPSHTAEQTAEPTDEARRQLVFFGEDWGRHPSTAQYLAGQLLEQHDVTWINSIGLREPTLSVADLGRVTGKLQRALGSSAAAPQTEKPSVTQPEPSANQQPQYLVSPWVLPWHRLGIAQALNKALFSRQIAQLPHLSTQPYSVVTANPASYYLLDTLQPASSLYYCADKYAHIAGLNPLLVERFERELLERVDAVAATSKPLVDDLSRYHANVHYLPHGVDFARFNSTLSLDALSTPAAPAAGRAVVGFVGLLGEHIDFKLIEDCASALPDVDFVFVGPVEQGVTLPQANNISYTGKVGQEELPAQLQRMHLCTLPYAMTERNHYANPTKVREYLAAGRGVVATRQPGLADVAGEVTIADDTAGFIAALQSQLAALATCDAATLTAHRAAIAAPMQAETWSARARVMLGYL